MSDVISQTVNIEMREKLVDGTYKLKLPKTTKEQIIDFPEPIISSFATSKVIAASSSTTISIPMGKIPTKYIKLTLTSTLASGNTGGMIIITSGNLIKYSIMYEASVRTPSHWYEEVNFGQYNYPVDRLDGFFGTSIRITSVVITGTNCIMTFSNVYASAGRQVQFHAIVEVL